MAKPIASDTERYRTTEEEMKQAQINLRVANLGAEHVGGYYSEDVDLFELEGDSR